MQASVASPVKIASSAGSPAIANGIIHQNFAISVSSAKEIQ